MCQKSAEEVVGFFVFLWLRRVLGKYCEQLKINLFSFDRQNKLSSCIYTILTNQWYEEHTTQQLRLSMSDYTPMIHGSIVTFWIIEKECYRLLGLKCLSSVLSFVYSLVALVTYRGMNFTLECGTDQSKSFSYILNALRTDLTKKFSCFQI